MSAFDRLYDGWNDSKTNVFVNGDLFGKPTEEIVLIADAASTSSFIETHSVADKSAQYCREVFSIGGEKWPVVTISRRKPTGTHDLFVQFSVQRLFSEIKGTPIAKGVPQGSSISRFAATGIKTAANLLKPPRQKGTLSLEDRNRETVRLYIEEFKNSQNFGIFPRLFSSQFSHHFGYPQMFGDMRSWVMTGQDFLRGFPDVHVTIHSLIGQGDHVVEHNTATGTHKGNFRGIAPTGRRITWSETHLYRIADGKIIENWPSVDFEDITRKLAARNQP